MNAKLILAAGAVCLFAVGGMARAQSAPQTAPPSTQPAMQQKAEAPAQPGTDTSYGDAASRARRRAVAWVLLEVVGRNGSMNPRVGALAHTCEGTGAGELRDSRISDGALRTTV